MNKQDIGGKRGNDYSGPSAVWDNIQLSAI
jgi:hypothetical protein